MRLLWQSIVAVCAFLPAASQTPPFVEAQMRGRDLFALALETSPESPATATLRRTSMAAKVKNSIQQAIDKNGPTVAQWHPLTRRQKFQVFVSHTYSPRTFAGAAIDAAADRVENHNSGYAAGFTGAAQRYGVELTTSETNVFFGRFLIPAVLKQDPRYFRNPSLPFLKRALYAMTRVLITRSDTGHQTFNASYVLGGAAAQALNDLYVPGHRQGMQPILDRLTFDLAIDSGFNLIHEFWPDIRRKLFHR
jgi:hypothetical protein